MFIIIMKDDQLITWCSNNSCTMGFIEVHVNHYSYELWLKQRIKSHTIFSVVANRLINTLRKIKKKQKKNPTPFHVVHLLAFQP